MEPTRLFDFAYYQAETHPLQQSLGQRRSDGSWDFYSTSEVIASAEKAAAGLLDLGLQPGDKVAITSYKNRPEWTIMDIAIQLAGLISIPLYPTISPREYMYILREAGVKVAFCGALDLYDKLAEAGRELPGLRRIYTFDRQENRPFWEEIFSDAHRETLATNRRDIQADDLATIIYTSGTTGNPKGVMLTHTNIAHVVRETALLIPGQPGDTVLSFLPLCHIFERAVSYVHLFRSFTVHYSGTDNLAGPTGDLLSARPVFFSTVPRLLEKIYEAIYNKGLQLHGLKKKLFFMALDLADNYEITATPGLLESVKWRIADKLIFSRWRAALGGQVHLVATGAAPCPKRILRVFCAAGIHIREGYGLTETSPTLTVNRAEMNGVVLGTVGYVIPGVEIYIDSSDGDYQPREGEILARGPNVTQGYYNNPQATEASFREVQGKRWFCTGDIGTFVDGPEGVFFLKITDRKKELLKTSGGKYVAPAPIESRIKEDFLIEQIMVVGDQRRFVSALIVPAEEALKSWCASNNVVWESLAQAVEEPLVRKHYQEILDGFNPEFSHVEQIKQFALVANTWLPIHPDGAEAELTPTLKLKRRVILAKYAEAIEAMYA